ncbi:GntR family transcriptional regulator [Oceanobacillus sp. FSL K6-2867]|uniref:GntR family transcriptional regulator n=1 Tax=Oceanobacillus sp. FSL K6-2867 TaxID=2954748 RepID=UPI0030D98EA1
MEKKITVSQRTMSEHAYQIMSDYIFNGTWEPGKSIKIRDTAKLLNTSEMPVREAVRMLVEHGLAIHRPHRGAVVTRLSLQELHDFYKVRILLEAEAARLGAENISSKDLDIMDKYWLELEQAIATGDSLKALNIDSEFLTTLYNSCGNNVLVDQIHSLWNRVQPYKVLWARSSLQSGLFSWKNKPKILKAAKQHDGELASQITVESLSDAVKSMEKMITD